MKRWWPAIPLASIALLLALRALLHDAPLDRLAQESPGTYTGSILVARGGPLLIGFQSTAESRLAFNGRELRGKGIVIQRIIVPAGPVAIRFVASDDARLVWSPVGRRGDPEYVGASSLSPEPPATATFDAPGTARLDGIIALALLAIVAGTCCMLARRRLARVDRQTWIAIGAVAAGALLIRLVGNGVQGQTWDEDVNWVAGKNYVTNLLSLDFSARSWEWNYEHPPVMKYLAGIGAQFADGFGPARALSALWVAIGCALLVPIGARLYSLRVGILAGVIAAFLPPLVAHGEIVGHEAPTVLWWTLGILLALGVHDEPCEKSSLRWRLVAVGVVIGIATASRFVNGLLGPVCAAIVVANAPREWRRATLGWGAALMPATAIATLYAVWPRLWLHPIAALEKSFDKLGKLHSVEPYLGTITNTPGLSYFVIYLFATLPVLIVGGVVLGIDHAWREVRAQRWQPIAIVAAWFVIPLVVTFSPVKQDGVRYVMPCVLVLAVLAAAGFDRAARWIGHPRAFTGLAGAVGLYLAITLYGAWPYTLDYFGEHVGGTGSVAAHRRFETAWWGEGLDRAVAYVNENAAPTDKVYYQCVEPNHLTWWKYELWAGVTNSIEQANWVVSYAPATRPCKIPPTVKPVFSVTAGGATLAVVYRRQ